MILEALGNIAVALEIGGRDTEQGSIRFAIDDAGRDGSSREEPHLDGGISPFHGVNTTPVGIEAGSISIGAVGIYITARGTTGRIESTVVQILTAGLAKSVNTALGICVKNSLVPVVRVYTLDNVNLAVLWPFAGAERPESRPGTADASRHVSNVCNEQTLGVAFLRLDTHGFASIAVVGNYQRSLVVHTKVL
jgi:hypothetical protein